VSTRKQFWWTAATREGGENKSGARVGVKSAKDTSTLWREAQVLVGDGGLVMDVADPLEVIEQVMKYFYGLGVHGAKSKAPVDQVQKCFQKALYAASLAAPFGGYVDLDALPPPANKEAAIADAEDQQEGSD
jgi:hypothetical protein